MERVDPVISIEPIKQKSKYKYNVQPNALFDRTNYQIYEHNTVINIYAALSKLNPIAKLQVHQLRAMLIFDDSTIKNL